MRLTDSVLGFWRMRAGCTQAAAAQALGVSPTTISKWEGGCYPPNAEKFVALCELYHLSAEQLQAALDKDAARYLKRLNIRHRMRRLPA